MTARYQRRFGEGDVRPRRTRRSQKLPTPFSFTFEDVEMAVGGLCSIVKGTYGGDKGGFIAGQVFKFSGFISDQGSLTESKTANNHYVIVTNWRSFEDHERSHADEIFANKFTALAAMCSDTKELGYNLLWQGEATNR